MKKVLKNKKPAKKVLKKLVKAVKADTSSVKFKVDKISNNVKKEVTQAAEQFVQKAEVVAGKVKKNLNPKVLIAQALAGITFIASLGAFSFYLARRGGKKIDFKKIKVNVLREARKATDEVKKVSEKEAMKFKSEMKKLAKKR